MYQIADCSYDAIIDKALFDCLIAEKLDHEKPIKMLSEIHRVLKPDGVFISVSAGSPPVRRPLLEREELFDHLSTIPCSSLYLFSTWTVSETLLVRPQLTSLEDLHPAAAAREHHFLYTCRKPTPPPDPEGEGEGEGEGEDDFNESRATTASNDSTA